MREKKTEDIIMHVPNVAELGSYLSCTLHHSQQQTENPISPIRINPNPINPNLVVISKFQTAKTSLKNDNSIQTYRLIPRALPPFHNINFLKPKSILMY